MKAIWADAAKSQDADDAIEFLCVTDGNLLDANVLRYPATKVLKASDGEKNIVFMPVQQCQVWESLGINPKASELEVAAGLKALAQVLRFLALANGEREIYFLCSEERTQKFAERHGFEKLNIPVFRLKL